MTAAFALSMAFRTAFAAQSPSAMSVAFAFSSFLDRPTAAGSTALCTAFRASGSEISAPEQQEVLGEEDEPHPRTGRGTQCQDPKGREHSTTRQPDR